MKSRSHSSRSSHCRTVSEPPDEGVGHCLLAESNPFAERRSMAAPEIQQPALHHVTVVGLTVAPCGELGAGAKAAWLDIHGDNSEAARLSQAKSGWLRPTGDEGFTASMAPCHRVRGGRLCPNGKRRRRKEIASRSRASPGHCRASFHRPFCLGRSAAHSYRRRHASQSIRIGGRIQFAPIAWGVRLPPAAERLAAGADGSATTARTDCQPHSERHRRPIANAHTRGVPDSAVCAGNRFIASAGMSICGTPVPTRMRSGTALAWSHGNSGMRRVARPGSCGVCKHDVAAKPADGCGRAPRLTTASRRFGCGANTGTRRGRSCSIIGACQTFR
jgi:hypothetical protein